MYWGSLNPATIVAGFFEPGDPDDCEGSMSTGLTEAGYSVENRLFVAGFFEPGGPQ